MQKASAYDMSAPAQSCHDRHWKAPLHLVTLLDSKMTITGHAREAIVVETKIGRQYDRGD